jgi:hypothetical protein
MKLAARATDCSRRLRSSLRTRGRAPTAFDENGARGDPRVAAAAIDNTARATG